MLYASVRRELFCWVMQLLLDIGTGTLDACCIPSIFAGEHSYSGHAPAHALYLHDIVYISDRKDDF